MALDVKKLIQVQALGVKLMDEHGLLEQGWKFELDTTKMRIGSCSHRKKRITVSMWYLEKSSDAEILDTILHEIAHALLPEGVEDHGWEWKDMALRVGATPERLAGEGAVSSAKPNYRIKCLNCGWFVNRFRMRQRNYGSRCPRCHTEVTIYRLNYGRK